MDRGLLVEVTPATALGAPVVSNRDNDQPAKLAPRTDADSVSVRMSMICPGCSGARPRVQQMRAISGAFGSDRLKRTGFPFDC